MTISEFQELKTHWTNYIEEMYHRRDISPYEAAKLKLQVAGLEITFMQRNTIEDGVKVFAETNAENTDAIVRAISSVDDNIYRIYTGGINNGR